MVWVDTTHRIQGCGATPAPDSGAPLEHHLDRPLVRALAELMSGTSRPGPDRTSVPSCSGASRPSLTVAA